MQDELCRISLDCIMEKLRKSEITKSVYGVPVFFPIQLEIDKFTIKKPIEIGEGYINKLGDCVVSKTTSIAGNIDTLINNSDYQQTLLSSSTSISYSCSKTTQMSVGMDIGKKISITGSIGLVELSAEDSLTFHLDTTQSITETQTITKEIPSQSIKVPPRTSAHVKAIMEKADFTGEAMICVGLSRFENGIAHITKPNRQNVDYKIDMLSHIKPTTSTPFPYDQKFKPITFKELKKGSTYPVELWTTGKYNVERASRCTVQVSITPLDHDKIIDNYFIEL